MTGLLIALAVIWIPAICTSVYLLKKTRDE